MTRDSQDPAAAGDEDVREWVAPEKSNSDVDTLFDAPSFRHRHAAVGSSSTPTSSSVGDDEEQAMQEEEEQDNNKEDDVQEEKLANTTFSLLFVVETNSKAYFYALFVICFQIAIVFAAVWDSLDLENSSNPGNFPPGVDTTVSLAQAAVIPLAVASQRDYIEAIVRLNDRLSENVGIDLSFTFAKWFASSMGQLIVGTGILTCIFLFTMQATTVFKVLINFAALILISNVSTVAFDMASRGFCGEAIWKDTLKVTSHVVKRRHKNNHGIQIAFLLSVCALYAGYGVVKHRQLSGYYLCNSVYVQYGDDYKLGLPFLSGVYSREPSKVANRFTYVDDVSRSRLRMAFCSSESAFGLSTHPEWANSRNKTADACDFDVISQPTLGYDITTTSHEPWRIFSERDNTLIDTSIFMQCVDCNSASCQPHRGTCVDNQCVCKDGRYGIHCNFQAPCEQLVLNANRAKFPPIRSIINEDYVVLAENYTLLRDNETSSYAMAYHRPVYVSEGYKYVLLFTGRRWAIISPLLFFEQDGNFPDLTEEELKDFLFGASRINLYDALNNPLLQKFAVSEAVDSGSNLDQGLPIGLQWLGMRAVRNARQPIMALDRQETFDARFLCAYCEEGVNDCENFGDCIDGTCQCSNGTVGFPMYTGALCERALLCNEAQEDFGDLLPTGCFGNYSCRQEDGNCDCSDLYPDSGRFCQFLPCYEETMQEIYPEGGCANGGVCSNRTGSCVCDADLFQGKYCQDPMPACFERQAQLLYPPRGCSNNGVCNNDTGFCECDDNEYEGRYCQTVLRNCNDQLMLDVYPGGCANNGTCNEDTGSCSCPSDIFDGRYCEREVASCNDESVQLVYPDGCANNGACDATTGSCVCENSTIYSGKYCQEVNDTLV